MIAALSSLDRKLLRDLWHMRGQVLAIAAVIRSFYATIGEFVLFYNMVASLLAGAIGFGVVYNSARIALSEGGRELASLRVLGFTTGEIAYILLGELAVLTLAAIPMGMLVGIGLVGILVRAFESELYRLPLTLNPDNYAMGAAVIVVSALLSGWLVRRKLGKLDLVAVLKTRVRNRYVISAPVAGHARRIELNVGDLVKAGQTVAEIDPVRSSALDPRSRAQAAAALRAADAMAAAAREKARAAAVQADLTRQELERTDSLRKSKFISEQALDKARSEFDHSQAAKLASDHDVTAAQFELERARATLAYATPLQGRQPTDTLAVRTPVDAHVLKVVHESKGTVSAGAPLIEVGNPASMEVEVLSSQAVKIAPGARVMFDRWGGDRTLEGTVHLVEPTGFTKVSALGVEEQRVRVIADFASPRAEWQRIGDGYRVEARFVVWEGTDILQIPASALFRHNNGWAVFVAYDGRARLRPIETGQRNGLQVQVLSGRNAGDHVVAHPDDKIGDGTRVKAR